MAEFPKQFALPDNLVHVTSLGIQSIGSYPLSSVPTSTVWPSSNLAIFIPFRISRPLTISKLFVYNGATVSGNIDLGVYSADGTKIISTGSTAHAGINVLQGISVTSTEIGAGVFYFAIALDNTTATVKRAQFGFTLIGRAVGCQQQATAFPLPANATFATLANNYLAWVGLTGRSVL